MDADAIKRLASNLSPDDLHKIILAMVDDRMDETRRSSVRGLELSALASACEAYEHVMFPI